MLSVKIAWRNIWRNSRRSVITIAAVVFALTLSIAQRGVQLGTYEANIRSAVRLSSGFLQIQKEGYQKNPTLRKSFPVADSLWQILESNPEITGFTPRIYADALLSHREHSFGIFIVGMLPSREKLVSDFHNKIHEGRFLEDSDSLGVVVGYKLMRNISAALGDSVVLLSQGFDGFLSSQFGRIVGTIKTGSDEFDRMAVFMNLPAAQQFLGMENRVSVVAISLKKLNAIPRVQSYLGEKLTGTGLAVLSWEEILPQLKQSIELDNIGGILFLAILIVVVAFGILNTVLMAVTERSREFGILLSLGMPNARLVFLIFLEAIFMVIIGLILGNLFGGLVNYYIVQHPITLGGEFAELYREYGFLPRIESTTEVHIFINSSLSVLLISVLSVLYPLWYVFKLEPLKGIRYT